MAPMNVICRPAPAGFLFSRAPAGAPFIGAKRMNLAHEDGVRALFVGRRRAIQIGIAMTRRPRRRARQAPTRVSRCPSIPANNSSCISRRDTEHRCDHGPYCSCTHLARRLGVSEVRIHEIAHQYRLPFAVATSSRQFFIREDDVPAYERAIAEEAE
jgi:hypothetical protein